MGTRSLICVFYNGRFVVFQYSQWDGYPSGQGHTILKFLHGSGNIERLIRGLEHLRPIERDPETRRFLNPDSLPLDHPSMSRDTGGKILHVIAHTTAEEPVPIYKDFGFINDSLLCEWAYVVDLDMRTFEIYKGSRDVDIEARARFQALGGGGVTSYRRFDLDDLPLNKESFDEACRDGGRPDLNSNA